MEHQTRKEVDELIQMWERIMKEDSDQPIPRPNQSWLSWWFEKSWGGIQSAIFLALLSFAFERFSLGFSPGFWSSLCLFLVLRPWSATTIFDGLIIANVYEREQEYTPDESSAYFNSLLIFSGYFATLFLLRLLRWSFWCIRSIILLFWEHPVLTCTLCVLPLSLGYLISRQASWLAYLRAKGGVWAAFIFRWILKIQYRIRIVVSKSLDWLASSFAIRFFSYFMQTVLLLILKQPTFEKLKEFTYSPLDVSKGHIRLLRIHRRIPFSDLKLELVCVPLDEAEPYQAISYYWGKDVEKSQRVILDNQQFKVTSTVWNILRRRSSIFASRLIWIDSICINQEDNKEKGNQVQIMGEIYEKASRVFVCLGNIPNAWLGISLLHELVIMSGTTSKSFLAEHIVSFLATKDTDEYLRARITSLLDLLHHPWFERIWIAQEVVAARSITVLYGNYEIIWDYLMLLMDIYNDPEISEIHAGFQYSGQEFVLRPLPSSPAKARALAHFQKAFREGQRAPLNATLRIFLASQSTCPRDKIFALLGFVEHSPGIFQLVDYDKNLSDVLYDVAKYLYLNEGCLQEVLHFAGIGWDGAEPGCPSWVPNWTISRQPATLAQSPFDLSTYYRAATQLIPQISIQHEARVLKFKGQQLDYIKVLSSVMKSPAPDRLTLPLEGVEDLTFWFRETQVILAENCTAQYLPTQQPITEAFWRTLIGDSIHSSRPAPSSFGEKFTKYLSLGKNLHDLKAKHGSDLLRVKSEMSEPAFYKEYFRTLEELMTFLRDMWNASFLVGQSGFLRAFCITASGYIGLVPEYTATGDMICLIYGSEVPFVLRSMSGEHEGDYQIVGECYVHGIMDGEALEPSKAEDFMIV